MADMEKKQLSQPAKQTNKQQQQQQTNINWLL